MRPILNLTPFAVGAQFLLDSESEFAWVIVVNSCFCWGEDGDVRLARRQLPPTRLPIHRGSPVCTSLQREGEFTPSKLGTDVLVEGHAHAGERIDTMEVALRVGELDKRLRVTGDRSWARATVGVKPGPIAPFERMPIIYERSFGGPACPANPVGIGWINDEADAIGAPLANIEGIDRRVESWDCRPAPAGFGPIDRGWSPRAERAGSYDERWRAERFPAAPSDMDPRHQQCAPDDQQCADFLVGGEAVELVGLHPAGVQRFTLPLVQMHFLTIIGDEPLYHRADLHTLTLRPDDRSMILSWVATVNCGPRWRDIAESRILGEVVS